MIQTKHLSRAHVLAALYNASRPQGMGFLHYDPKPMTVKEAETLFSHGLYFDYLKGHVMKVDLSQVDPAQPETSGFEEGLYDRDNGHGAASAAIIAVLLTGLADTEVTRMIHDSGKS